MKHKALTLVELVIVFAIIGILAAVILVSLSAGKQRAMDQSALESISSVRTEVYRCLLRNYMGDARFSVINPGEPICVLTTEPDTAVPGFGVWPDFFEYGYKTYEAGDRGFCAPGSNLTNPPDDCVDYEDGSCGGERSTARFCYRLSSDTSDTKEIWCTEQGCGHTGF
ncbi:MAG: hypothetical protein QG620_598 [Patescibacteria group bacterium]|nr:hypothetical protein [Patescibacteria group bacterium]